MNDQQRAAIQMALEALENWRKGFTDLWEDADEVACDALREALAQPTIKESLTVQPQGEFNCYGDGNVYRGVRSKDSEIQTIVVPQGEKRQFFGDVWGPSELEPVPQGEPVAFEQCEELSADKARWYRMADMIEQQAQELKGVLRQALNLIEGEWPEGDEVAQPVVDKIKKIVGERSDG